MKPLTREWIDLAEGDWGTAARDLHARKSPNYHSACFHAQQCAEKYLKAALVECGQAPARIHDLRVLLSELLTTYPLWAVLQQPASHLTGFAVRIRYPGANADRSIAKEAVALCGIVRETVRQQFGLPIDPPPSRRRRRPTGRGNDRKKKRSSAAKAATPKRARKRH